MRRSVAALCAGAGGGSGSGSSGPIERARAAVTRPLQAVRRYVDESLEALRPMDNPPGYNDEAEAAAAFRKSGVPARRTGWCVCAFVYFGG